MVNLAAALPGVVLGTLVAPALGRLPRVRDAALAAVAAALLVWSQATPFTFEFSGGRLVSSFQRIEWWPLAAYLYADPRAVFVDVTNKIMLNSFVAFTFGRLLRRPVGGAVTAALLASALELGQLFAPGRIPSTTDLLVILAGAWIGQRLLRAASRQDEMCTRPSRRLS
jgi:hypothetical protein